MMRSTNNTDSRTVRDTADWHVRECGGYPAGAARLARRVARSRGPEPVHAPPGAQGVTRGLGHLQTGAGTVRAGRLPRDDERVARVDAVGAAAPLCSRRRLCLRRVLALRTPRLEDARTRINVRLPPERAAAQPHRHVQVVSRRSCSSAVRRIPWPKMATLIWQTVPPSEVDYASLTAPLTVLHILWRARLVHTLGTREPRRTATRSSQSLDSIRCPASHHSSWAI
eukprot:2474040-Pleurochrysis_carterae.AAC.2